MHCILPGKAHVNQTDVVPPSIPQTSLLFILIGVLCRGEGLWVIRLTGICARVVYNLLLLSL